MAKFWENVKTGWNAFRGIEENPIEVQEGYTTMSTIRSSPYRFGFTATEGTIVASIYNQLALDSSAIAIRHIRTDQNGRYTEDVDSGLNSIFNLEANIDQDAREFRRDFFMTLFEVGHAVLLPIDISNDPFSHGSFDIRTMRVGTVVSWGTNHVVVEAYDDRALEGGTRRQITVSKDYCAIVTNPLYSVMNEPNSTLQRLIRKLNLLDSVDEAASSGKLDLIIQLPYTIKSEARREQANKRRTDIEEQLREGKYGIAYTDATERITQLNRPVENNLLKQIEYLTKLLYNQLGLSESVFDGTADEATMINYFNRTIEPLVTSFTLGCKRKFLSKTARAQGQSVEFFREPFKLVPVAQLAEIADKFTRNEILSSNEFRSVIGFKPVNDPKADELRNKNLPEAEPALEEVQQPKELTTGLEGDQNGT